MPSFVLVIMENKQNVESKNALKKFYHDFSVLNSLIMMNSLRPHSIGQDNVLLNFLPLLSVISNSESDSLCDILLNIFTLILQQE